MTAGPLPPWWGVNGRQPVKPKAPIRHVTTPTRRASMPRALPPRNAVLTPGGTRVNTPKPPKPPAKAHKPRPPRPPVKAKPPKPPKGISPLAARKKLRLW